MFALAHRIVQIPPVELNDLQLHTSALFPFARSSGDGKARAVLRVVDEDLEQLIEVGPGRFDKHAPVAANGYRPVATRVGPALLGHPLHLT